MTILDELLETATGSAEAEPEGYKEWQNDMKKTLGDDGYELFEGICHDDGFFSAVARGDMNKLTPEVRETICSEIEEVMIVLLLSALVGVKKDYDDGKIYRSSVESILEIIELSAAILGFHEELFDRFEDLLVPEEEDVNLGNLLV